MTSKYLVGVKKMTLSERKDNSEKCTCLQSCEYTNMWVWYESGKYCGEEGSTEKGKGIWELWRKTIGHVSNVEFIYINICVWDEAKEGLWEDRYRFHYLLCQLKIMKRQQGHWD